MYPNSPRLVPSVYRAILFLWGLGVMAIILGTTCSILGWRRLSGSQAALYSRWLVANEMAREQRSVERARAARLRQR
jgi:predicted exporter